MNLLFIADCHFRETKPICRIDDFIITQLDKINFIKKVSEEYKVKYIFQAGDLLDTYKVSISFLNWLIDNLPYMYCIVGNHDMPSHNLNELDKSALSILHKAEVIRILNEPLETDDFILYPFHFGQDITSPEKTDKVKIALWHRFIIRPNEVPAWKNDMGLVGNKLFRYGYDLVFTGDNHEYIKMEKEGRYVINGGSLLRLNVDQIEHTPKIFVYNTNNRKVKEIEIPIQKDCISTEHIDVLNKKINTEDFLKTLKGGDWTINFRKNIEIWLNENKVKTEVKEKVMSILQE
jgi:predicted phosphodiesterase